MARSHRPSSTPRGCLGIEAGGTRTTALWQDDDVAASQNASFGPCNLQLLSDHDLLALLSSVAHAMPRPRAVAIGMAGARTADDRARIVRTANRCWPGAVIVAVNDLETALAADLSADTSPRSQPAVLVLSGTGSCCYGTSPGGSRIQVGGWGHILGDQGSAHAIALNALRAALQALDEHETWGTLGRRLLAALHFNEPNELVPWARSASKADIAALAPTVFQAAAERDAIARHILDLAAHDLASGALACARRIAPRRSEPIRFVLAGGVLQNQPGFARTVGRRIRRGRAGALIRTLRRPGAAGAVELARLALAGTPETEIPPLPRRDDPTLPARLPDPTRLQHRPLPLPVAMGLSPTEERNPRSRDLDRLALDDAVSLMLQENDRIGPALQKVVAPITRAIRHIVRALRSGGRLFYVGAGTSGRLGVLDASECPPTFRTPPDLIQGILAGGPSAMFRSCEGAEDDFQAGAAAMIFRGVGSRDVVVGIAASGRTPFVWGALNEARQRRATTVLVGFNPRLRFPSHLRPNVIILPDLGPEVLTGSTRLNAGTATKVILNLFTTLAMVRMGKVVSNLMVDLNPSNAKLRDRAIRITRELTGAGHEDALRALTAAGWQVKKALHSLHRSSVGSRRAS